jgi:hypothetical protein
LYAKLSKCKFWLKQVTFLGHIISKGGISVDPRKVEDVLSWKAPTCVGDIWNFLGLARCYWRFIEGFSKISKLMIMILEKIQEIKHNIKEEKSPGFLKDEERVLWYRGRICLPNVKELKDKILCEAQESAYSIPPGRNKMYHGLKATDWWYEMKRDVAEYIALCDTCQRVKAEHQ